VTGSTADYSQRMYTWHRVAPEILALADDDSGRIVRQVAEQGPYLGNPSVIYRVTGPGYDATDHSTLEDAMATAEASVP
jgi:hypothetical protein